MRRIWILAFLLSVAGCGHTGGAVRIDVPSLATLRSYVPQDLRPTLPAVDPSMDGRVAFQAASKLLPKSYIPIPTTDQVRMRPSNFEAQLKPFDKGLEAIVSASRLPDWSTVPDDSFASPPTTASSADFPIAPISEYARIKNAVKLLVVRARTDMVLGRLRAADEYLAIKRLAEVSCRGRQPLTGFLVGIALMSIGEAAIQADANGMSEPMLQAVLGGLPDESVLRNGAAESFRVELDSHLVVLRWTLKNISNVRETHWAPIRAALKNHPDPFDAPATVGLIAQVVRANIETILHPNGGSPLPSAVSAELFNGLVETPMNSDDAIWPDPNELQQRLEEMQNPLGLLIASTTFATNDMPEILSRHENGERATRLIVALNLYRIRHKSLPAKLQDLVTQKILSRVPLDQFDGKPFRYDPRRAIILVGGPRWAR